MRVLITGNMGYVGPLVVKQLAGSPHAFSLIGFDAGFFAHCLTGGSTLPERLLAEQRFGDVRDLTAADLAGFDAVVHLAAISNDPMGKRFEQVTDEINHQASVKLAELALRAKVRSFVFASSCSVYGFAADGKPRTEQDPVEPLTAYARSKIATEQSLQSMDCSGMTVSCLRFATACGMSDRLRLDLVLNDFVACALSSGTITVLSDGTPWRPLIDVSDMARAIEWAILRTAAPGDKPLIVNVGSERWNYQVRDLAQAVAAVIPGTSVSINTEAPPDRRSYKVDFSLFERLAPSHQPIQTLESSITGLRDGLQAMGFHDATFRESNLIRLRVLDGLQNAGLADFDHALVEPVAPERGMKFHKTSLNDAHLVELEKRGDDRGFFARFFCEKEFANAGLVNRFVQLNNSLSAKQGTLRGLHYQLAPSAEVKIVRCIKGSLFDAIADLRPDSSTFGQWFGAELNQENRLMMYVPRGFAHAILTLTDDTEALYMVSDFYAPQAERGMRYDDPWLGVKWPIEPEEISPKDRAWPLFDPEFHGVEQLRGIK